MIPGYCTSTVIGLYIASVHACVCVCVCIHPPRSVSVLLVAVLTWGLSALLIAVTPLTPIRSHYHPREDRYRLLYLIS